MVFQRDVLLAWRTVLDNLVLPMISALSRGSDIPNGAHDLLGLFGLAGFEASYPVQLSGGMSQPAAICRPLLAEPNLLVMDEPFGALGVLTSDQMNFELQRVWSITGQDSAVRHSLDRQRRVSCRPDLGV